MEPAISNPTQIREGRVREHNDIGSIYQKTLFTGEVDKQSILRSGKETWRSGAIRRIPLLLTGFVSSETLVVIPTWTETSHGLRDIWDSGGMGNLRIFSEDPGRLRLTDVECFGSDPFFYQVVKRGRNRQLLLGQPDSWKILNDPKKAFVFVLKST
ncbi:hypothetical protein VTL71DRAFT_15233 [Oculimacula yallundae]|uniref:Uncharacterized protein n=1 Tax=Oculimacula yallundae TaxID=86028 RepID=A0ABR4CFZ9_9HELO